MLTICWGECALGQSGGDEFGMYFFDATPFSDLINGFVSYLFKVKGLRSGNPIFYFLVHNHAERPQLLVNRADLRLFAAFNSA